MARAAQPFVQPAAQTLRRTLGRNARGQPDPRAKDNKPRRAEPQRLQRVVRGLRHEGRTLLVEPTPDDAKALKFHLTNALGPRSQIVTATTPAEAIVEFARYGGAYDLLMLNQKLARAETGIKLFRYLRLRLPHPDEVKPVLYGSEIEPQVRKEALAIGFTHVFNMDELGSTTELIDQLWKVLKPNIDWSASWRGLP